MPKLGEAELASKLDTISIEIYSMEAAHEIPCFD